MLGSNACRYGGEEFAVVLAGTPADLAYRYGTSIRDAVARLCPESQAAPVVVTMSGGLSCSEEWAADYPLTPAELLETADRALYVAKSTGRNRIIAFANPNGPSRGAKFPSNHSPGTDEGPLLGAQD
jgi:diguanylate cyclase (GGDEF)-like protein